MIRRSSITFANGHLPREGGREELVPGRSGWASFNGNIHLDLTNEVVITGIITVVRLGYFNGSEWTDCASVFSMRYSDIGPKTADNNHVSVSISGPSFNLSPSTEAYTHGWIFVTVFTKL